MKRFNTQTRFVPLKIDKDFNVEHIQSKDGKIKDFKTRKAVEKYYLDIRFFVPAASDCTRHASKCIQNNQYQTIASPTYLLAGTPLGSYHI